LNEVFYIVKILLINQSFVSPDEPGHTRHFEMAQFLQKHGHELVIVGSDVNYQTGRPTTKRERVFEDVEQVIDGVRILRAYVYPSLHRSYFWRIISFFSFMFSSILAALRVRDVDLVMGTTPPIFQAVSAWFVSLVRRRPFLLEVRDLWPEFGVGMGVLTNPIIIALARWLENFLYARATHILVNSPAYRNYLLEKGLPEKKVTFIPYGTDVDMFNPQVDGSAIRRKLGVEDKFVVLYAGALGQANDIFTLLRAAERLRDQPDIRFVLFGDGKERIHIEEERRRKSLENVIIAGVYPKKEMPFVLASSDVCLAILQNIRMFRTTYPNKVFDYMAAGRATVLVIDGVIREVIETSHGGVFVEPGDDEQLAKTLLELSRDRPRVRQMGIDARAYLVKHLNRRDRLDETLRFLQSLVKAE
jgi:glycosyltransferase involved in cell wall biosynthesis